MQFFMFVFHFEKKHAKFIVILSLLYKYKYSILVFSPGLFFFISFRVLLDVKYVLIQTIPASLVLSKP